MKCSFAPKTEFSRELNRRVRRYLAEQKPREARRHYILRFSILALWFCASYVGLVFFANTVGQALLLSLSLGLAMAGVGFGIMHSANHGSLPFSPRVCRALGWSLDVLGASSYVWRFKHNVAHHTYTNIHERDGDLEAGSIARLSPHQPWRPVHRVQHLYLWPLYALSAVNWILISDWYSIARCRNKFTDFPKPSGHEAVLLWLGKATTFSLWFVIPMLFRPWYLVIAFSILTMMILGFVLAVVFQLAHVVEPLEFSAATNRVSADWASHQVETTANFATQNRLLTWYLGGLNHQIEHHLFASVPDVHYARIADIVETCCREFGRPYHRYETFRSALASHGRMLHALGQPPALGVVVANQPA